jgi:PAS domain S-box-containing protein
MSDAPVSEGLVKAGLRDAVQLAAWREELLVATGLAAERMLNAPQNVDAFRAALGTLGEAARVSRVYVFEIARDLTGRELCTQIHEWCAAGIASEAENPNLRDFPMREAGFGRWLDEMGRDRPIFGRISDFPPAERAVLEGQGILSLAAVPVLRQRLLWGFIGFDDCWQAQKWTVDTIGCLQVAARVLGAALERMQYQRRSESLEAEYRELVESLESVVFRATADGHWTFLSPAWTARLGWKVETSVGRPIIGFVASSDRRRVLEMWRRALHEGRYPERVEILFRSAEGGACWMLANVRVQDAPIPAARVVTGTLIDITAAKEAEAEPISAREAAEAANKVKSDFMSAMSHELRTPLNAVIGLSESLLEMTTAIDTERMQRYLGMIRDSGRQLLAQINDVLDLVRIDASRVQLSPTRFDLGVVLAAAADRSRRDAGTKGLSVVLNRPPEAIMVQADERLLRQVVNNLVSNAIKFTPARGRVELSLRLRADGGPSIVVRDTGIGIPEDRRDELFKPFSKLVSLPGHQAGGTGLGLALVDRLVRLHGGRVTVESAVGSGSVFTVELPASVMSPPVPLP